jgi:hypothetical protein
MNTAAVRALLQNFLSEQIHRHRQSRRKNLTPRPLLDGTEDLRECVLSCAILRERDPETEWSDISTNDGASSRMVSHHGAKSEKSRHSFNSRRLHHIL